MGGPVTKDDLWDLRDTLSAQSARDRAALAEQFERGISGMHERLDTLNGRVGRGEVQGGEHGVRLVNLEREVFKRQRAGSDSDATAERRDDSSPITRRDLKVAGYVLAAAAGTLGFLFKLLPWALKAIAP
jgi:hypothetical protein